MACRTRWFLCDAVLHRRAGDGGRLAGSATGAGFQPCRGGSLGGQSQAVRRFDWWLCFPRGYGQPAYEGTCPRVAGGPLEPGLGGPSTRPRVPNPRHPNPRARRLAAQLARVEEAAKKALVQQDPLASKGLARRLLDAESELAGLRARRADNSQLVIRSGSERRGGSPAGACAGTTGLPCTPSFLPRTAVDPRMTVRETPCSRSRAGSSRGFRRQPRRPSLAHRHKRAAAAAAKEHAELKCRLASALSGQRSLVVQASLE